MSNIYFMRTVIRIGCLSMLRKLAVFTVFVFVLISVTVLRGNNLPRIVDTLTGNTSGKINLERAVDTHQHYKIVEKPAEVDTQLTGEMEQVIEEIRKQITNELKGYKLSSASNIDQLIPEEGGVPVRSVVVATWRTGSTFIGEVLDSHPATYHFSEPLTPSVSTQVRDEPLASEAVSALHSMLTCNYTVLGQHVGRSRYFSWLQSQNTRLWQHCARHKGICWSPQFLQAACRLFPFQSMKTVHVRLRLMERLLADPRLNMRVVLLVRDPRAVMESRLTMDWCLVKEDCISPINLCADMLDDYSAALRFTKLFPDSIRVVRYEDLALRPEEVVPELFQFFGLQYHTDVRNFVKAHTSQKKTGKFTTYRNSSEVAFAWRNKITYQRVQKVQSVCRVALTAWGYRPAFNASHLTQFIPIAERPNLPF